MKGIDSPPGNGVGWGVIKKVVESLEKAGVRDAFRKGTLRCPDCGAKPGELPDKWGGVMRCGACGARTSLSEWTPGEGAGRLAAGDADRVPTGTRIRKESAGPDSAVWHVPANGKFGFFLFFGVFWLLITAVVSGGFLLAFPGGEEPDGDFPVWVATPFFGLFWVIGLGVLYSALRQKFMRYRIAVGGGKVTLRKEMFGRSSEKGLNASSVASVSQQVFYSQNYTPVYGIEIKGPEGKLRFGSGLGEEEKAWLVADLKRTMRGREPEASAARSVFAGGLAPIKVKQGKEVFSVEVPGAGMGAVVTGLVFALFGIGFVCVGIFLIDGEPWPDSSGGSGPGEWFSLISFLFANGFRTFWILFSSVFAVIGVSVTVAALRGMGSERRIEGNAAEVSIRTYKRGLVLKDQSFPRAQVADMRTSNSGHNNGKPMKRVDLIVGDKVVKIASWMDGDAADAMAAEVREALGK